MVPHRGVVVVELQIRVLVHERGLRRVDSPASHVAVVEDGLNERGAVVESAQVHVDVVGGAGAVAGPHAEGAVVEDVGHRVLEHGARLDGPLLIDVREDARVSDDTVRRADKIDVRKRIAVAAVVERDPFRHACLVDRSAVGEGGGVALDAGCASASGRSESLYPDVAERDALPEDGELVVAAGSAREDDQIVHGRSSGVGAVDGWSGRVVRSELHDVSVDRRSRIDQFSRAELTFLRVDSFQHDMVHLVVARLLVRRVEEDVVRRLDLYAHAAGEFGDVHDDSGKIRYQLCSDVRVERDRFVRSIDSGGGDGVVRSRVLRIPSSLVFSHDVNRICDGPCPRYLVRERHLRLSRRVGTRICRSDMQTERVGCRPVPLVVARCVAVVGENVMGPKERLPGGYPGLDDEIQSGGHRRSGRAHQTVSVGRHLDAARAQIERVTGRRHLEAGAVPQPQGGLVRREGGERGVLVDGELHSLVENEGVARRDAGGRVGVVHGQIRVVSGRRVTEPEDAVVLGGSAEGGEGGAAGDERVGARTVAGGRSGEGEGPKAVAGGEVGAVHRDGEGGPRHVHTALL